ncbi:MAG: hypothetical protein IPI33_06610 [Dehalococcoidia bacterium]|jgi:hypothetical protein|uniref:hypothetical protein n=1 Tax=Candidatus Amarobacter glycogenicus TaxID=3140699 RepID=UPI001DE9EC8B|nr:hypothetical protein [Dehalococcoidia bacterium]MBK6560829.1 hypothetical protein [Dehalococcoidia bacterium]MBK7724910.1 hypothetical protein [Dehalococcoidia bacterium]MBK8560021.1 hypothetical protein [Dehalococcoidia bacterium]MBK9342235.1 hypothetical protein [Dehalococcoidia bacterium]
MERPLKPTALAFLWGSILGTAMLTAGPASAHVVAGRVAILSPVSGAITTLECYDGPSFAPCITGDPNGDGVTGPHAGQWSSRIDIGNATNQTTWVQVDYLPNGVSTGVSGGYAIAYKLSTYCSQWEPGHSSYNGKLVQIDLLYYDTSAAYINGNSLLFQHVAPNYRVGASGSSALWYHWNNAYNSVKLWPTWAENFKLNNLSLGGMDVATVASFPAGSPPATCAGASHLHMENSVGEYNPSDYLGKSVTQRYNDAQYMHLPGITGTAPY